MTRKSFDVALAKGEYGERIVRRILESHGFVVYKPETEGAHAFDILAIKDKSRCIALDVKAKARRNKYPDTGINMTHWRTYVRFSETHMMPFWLVFVDEALGSIYGNTIAELDAPRVDGGIQYPLVHGGEYGTRYWPLSAMRVLHKITTTDSIELAALSQRSYDYNFKQ